MTRRPLPLALLVACSALAGCGEPAPSPPVEAPAVSAAEAPPLPPVNLTIGTWARVYEETILSGIVWQEQAPLRDRNRPEVAHADVCREPCPPTDGRTQVHLGDLDRIRIEMRNPSHVPRSNFSFAFLIPPGVRVIEGNTSFNGTLPANGAYIEAVVQFVVEGDVRIPTHLWHAPSWGAVREETKEWLHYNVRPPARIPALPRVELTTGIAGSPYSERILSGVREEQRSNTGNGMANETSEVCSPACAHDERTRVPLREYDRIRFEMRNPSNEAHSNFSFGFVIPRGVTVVEGETWFDGTLPPSGVFVEAVVRFVEPGPIDIYGKVRWVRSDRTIEDERMWLAYSVVRHGAG